jgi:proteasome assembly chaperone (PAC2) family protein
VVGGVAVRCLDGFGGIHFTGDLFDYFRFGGEFTLAAHRFGEVLEEQRALGAVADRHLVPPSLERDVLWSYEQGGNLDGLKVVGTLHKV